VQFLWAVPIFLAVAAIQIVEGSYRSDLATHSDEAAHFVTATCLLDYFKTGFGSGPIAFAEQYYVRFPKVAFGHWPPAFSAIQAVWYSVVGATPATGILLVGLIAAMTGLVLFVRIGRSYGTWIAACSVAVCFNLPVVQVSVSLLMPDLLASACMSLCVLTFCDGLRSGARRSWIASAAWGTVAILTKESALALFLFAPAGLILIGHRTQRSPTERTVRWRVWIGLCLSVALVLAAYALTGVLRLRDTPGFLVLNDVRDRLKFLPMFLRMAPWAVFVIATLGVLGVAVRTKAMDRPFRVYEQGALLWLVVWLITQVLFRDVVEQRYFLPAILMLVFLFAAGLDRVSRWSASLTSAMARPRWAASASARLVPAAIAVFCVAFSPSNILRFRTGYDQVAASLPSADAAPVVLVSSDASGEGAMIVARLVHDEARVGVVLRASKMLARSDWMGRRYQMLATSSQEVRASLDAIPVQFVVMDMHGFVDEGTRPHHRLLEQAIKEAPEQFQLVANLPLSIGDRRLDGAIQVYENINARGRRPEVVRVPMTDTLGRTLELHLHDRTGAGAGVQGGTGGAPAIGARIRNVADRLGALIPTTPSPVSPWFQISPASDTLDEESGTGQIHVTTSSDRGWVVQSSAPWISIMSSRQGMGDGVVTYALATNRSNEGRRADILIGEKRYPVFQRGTRDVQIPFVDRFNAPPERWILEDYSGRSAMTFDLTSDGDRSALILSKPARDRDVYQTQIYLPRIDTEPGGEYQLSLSLKADPPGSLWVAFSQRTAPFKTCGLSEALTVPASWKSFVVRFTPSAPDCGADKNRLSLEVGHLSGRLWVSDVSLTRQNAR